MVDWRHSRTYRRLKPYVPDSLRRLAARLRHFNQTRIRRDRVLDFNVFGLQVSNRESGGILHHRTHWSEVTSPVERDLAFDFCPDLFLDIGANYGFASALHCTLNPGCEVIAIEPNPMLIPYIQENLRRAGCRKFTVLNAVCASEAAAGGVSFSLNPVYSQDPRWTGQILQFVDGPNPAFSGDDRDQ